MATAPAKNGAAAAGFYLDDWLVQPELHQLTGKGGTHHVEPKVMQVLVALAEHAGEVVSKGELLRSVWAETFVTEHVLTHAIWQLRRIFGSESGPNEWIQTVPKRGYRLVAPVRRSVPPIRAIAVLPLVNLCGDAEQEYLADGVTEALITDLAQIGALRVISRTSSMLYKGTSKPLGQIARELNVDGVVEGSVMRSGERLRISAQLIQATTDQHLWARNYEGSLGDVLRLQGEVAREVAEQIQVILTSRERTQLERARTVCPAAHDSYLRGRYCYERLSEEGLQKSIGYMQEAIRLDPDFALGYVGLANAYSLLASPIAGAIVPGEANRVMRPLVMRALELDDTLAEAHFLLGWMKVYYEWDWEGAQAAHARAIELNPNYSLAYAGIGTVCDALGQREQAERAWRHACDLDPLSLMCNTLLGWSRVLAGRTSDGLEQLQKTVALEPNFWFSQEVLGLALLQLGRTEEAVLAGERALRLASNVFPKGVLGHIYGRAGRVLEAGVILGELEKASAQRYVSPCLRAFVLAALPEPDAALDLLDQAYALRDPALIWLRSFPVLWGLPLQDDARYRDLLRRMKLGD